MSVKKKTSSVRSLSHLFTFILILVILGISTLLFFAFKDLPPYATTVNQKLEQANLSSPTDSTKTSTSMLALRAEKFFSTADTYESRAKTDLQKYAQLTGISLQNITPDAQGAEQNLRTLSVQVANPVPYSNLLQFITAIEGNVPHMSVQSLSLRQSGAPSANTITVQSLKISVTLR